MAERRAHRFPIALVITCAGVFAAPEARAGVCTVEYDGATFLLEASRRGITIPHNCHKADLASNRFYAPPGAACMIKFRSGDWLPSGWRFERIEGRGSFSTLKEGSVVTITIDKGRAFKVRKVVTRGVGGSCSEEAADPTPREN